MLQFWIPVGVSLLGANGAIWGLIQWRITHRKVRAETGKTGAETADLFTEMAERLALNAEKVAQREHDDNERLRLANEQLSQEVRALRAEVEELRTRLTRMQQDVSATRTAVERQAIVEDLRWLGAEAPDQNQNND